ncbi:hypothetical protein [Nocardia sp. NPDC057455]|uniref:hypothetical protein n=1 Tax=Nocardia sp. NPDC057455 TaxID=3346138 RepID=UPI00366F9225
MNTTVFVGVVASAPGLVGGAWYALCARRYARHAAASAAVVAAENARTTLAPPRIRAGGQQSALDTRSRRFSQTTKAHP